MNFRITRIFTRNYLTRELQPPQAVLQSQASGGAEAEGLRGEAEALREEIAKQRTAEDELRVGRTFPYRTISES